MNNKIGKPRTIREFKYLWLKEKYHSFSDEDIKRLMAELVNNKRYITLGGVTINTRIEQ